MRITDADLKAKTVEQLGPVKADLLAAALPRYTTATRPAPGDVEPGFMLWNTDEEAPNYSNGIVWVSIRNTTRIVHQPIASSGRSRAQPAAGPDPVVIGSFIGSEYTTPASDALYSEFKVPTTHDGDYAAFHIHWTKSADNNESGNAVRFLVDIVQVDGTDDDVNVASTQLVLDDTYDDAGTTTRIVHRTSDVEFTATPGYYVGVRVSVDGGNTTLTGNAVLISCDLRMSQLINR